MSRIPSIFSHSSGFPLSCVHGLDLLEGILCSELCKTLHSKASQFSSKMHFLQKKKKKSKWDRNLFKPFLVRVHCGHCVVACNTCFTGLWRERESSCRYLFRAIVKCPLYCIFFPPVLKTEEHPSSLYPNRPPTTKPPVTICSLVCSMINQITCYRQKKKQRPAQNYLSCNMWDL